MFAQVIEFPVSDAAAFAEAMRRWTTDIGPTAEGYLGGFSGVDEDGNGMVVVEYDTAEHAYQQAARPEQQRWLTENAALNTGTMTIKDSVDILDQAPGDVQATTFIQIFQGQSRDVDKGKAALSRHDDQWAQHRPDMVRSLLIMHADAEFTLIGYSTDGALAQAKLMDPGPPDVAADIAELQSLDARPSKLINIHNPVVDVAGR